MPRFLNTWTGEFEWHPDPSTVTYAIISHVWRDSTDGGEQSYDDVCRIQAAAKKGRSTTYDTLCTEYQEEETIFARPALSDKVKGFCKVAREAGYRLAWNDACCIDKTSSAELSEAINSMYEWYRLSDMCYVYLADVSRGDRPQDRGSEFRRSRWHTRGWTLQELIAPERVEFLTRDWRFLGTKTGLAPTLERITGVDVSILTGRVALDSVGVARRISWAQQRETTRVEDRAYSLMGLFSVHLSATYGEGHNAFLRLQEEIIRTIPDHSLFAWGSATIPNSLITTRPFFLRSTNDYEPYLLADSPQNFPPRDIVHPISSESFASRLRLEPSDIPSLHCVFTPQGIRVVLLCLELANLPQAPDYAPDWTGRFRGPLFQPCPECGHWPITDRLALLRCEDSDGHLAALPLCQPRPPSNDRGLSITTYISCGACPALRHRVVLLKTTVLEEVLEHLRPVPIELHLLHRNSSPLIPKSCVGLRLEVPAGALIPRTRTALLADDGHAAVGISPRSVKALAAIGCYHSPLDVTYSEPAQDISLETTLTLPLDHNNDEFEEEPDDEFDSDTEFSREETSSASQQVIRLSISLSSYTPSTPKRPPNLNEKQPPEDDTQARFSVTIFTHIPYDLPSSSSPLHDSGTGNRNDTAGMQIFETPCVDGSGGTRTYTFNTGGTLQRIVAQADFVVPSSLGPDREDDRCTVRLLRLALELPHPGARSPNDIWLSIDLSERYERPVDNAGPSPAVPLSGGSSRPPGATDPVLHARSERIETLSTSESVMIPVFEHPGRSRFTAQPQLSQKRPRQASSNAGSLGIDHAKRVCLAEPQTDNVSTDGFSTDSFSTDSFSAESLPTETQEVSYSHLTGATSFRSTAAHGMYGDGQFIASNGTWSGRIGEGVAIISPEVLVPPSGHEHSSAVDNYTDTEVLAFAGELPRWLYDVAGRSDTPASERVDSAWPPPGYSPSVSTTYLEGDRLEPAADADTPYVRRDSVDALRHENNALRAQIEGLSSQNTALSSQMQDMASKMTAVLARLETITNPADPWD